MWCLSRTVRGWGLFCSFYCVCLFVFTLNLNVVKRGHRSSNWPQAPPHPIMLLLQTLTRSSWPRRKVFESLALVLNNCLHTYINNYILPSYNIF